MKRTLPAALFTALMAAVWLIAQPAGDSVVDGLRLVEVASVSDAMEQLYGQRAYMSHEMRPLSSAKFAGPAVTVLLRNSRKTECGANQFLTRWVVRAAPFALLRNSRKTECGANLFLTRWVVRAAPFALLRNSRKTECGANRFLIRWAVRAAPFALLKKGEHKEGSAASQGMLDLIDAAAPGSVYVMVLEDGGDYAGIGGRMATAMKYRGFSGAIVDGSVRDTPQIRKLQFPVFSRGVVPSTTINHYRFAGVNVPVTCAGVSVNPGDIVVADEDGVAVVPRAHAAEVFKKSQELDDTEHRTLPFIERFRSIKEAVKQFGRI